MNLPAHRPAPQRDISTAKSEPAAIVIASAVGGGLLGGALGALPGTMIGVVLGAFIGMLARREQQMANEKR